MELKRKIKAVSMNRLEEGSIGFITDQIGEENLWYNVTGETEVLKELMKNVIAKGNTIEFEFNNNVVGNLKLIEKALEDKHPGDDMTNFEELLDAAHKKFAVLEIKTEMIQVDFEKREAIFKAIINADRNLFVGHGDACGITSEKVKAHFMRMAETRAISRALRWATNNAKVAVEETSEKPTQ